jgi:hypothetical protein
MLVLQLIDHDLGSTHNIKPTPLTMEFLIDRQDTEHPQVAVLLRQCGIGGQYANEIIQKGSAHETEEIVR